MSTIELSRYSKMIHPRKDDPDQRGILEKCESARAIAAKKNATFSEKPRRIVDRKAIARCKQWGKCQWTGAKHTKRDPLQVAHIKSKAAGGDDVDENLVLLAKSVHESAHMRGEPSRQDMLEMAQERIRRKKIAPSAFTFERLIKEQNELSATSKPVPS